MRKAAKILAVGIAVTVPLLPPLTGAATSQTADSRVINGQVQLGDVLASQVLNVDVATDQIVATTMAAGNTLSGAVQTGTLTLRSTQSMQGDARASTVLNVTGDAGPLTALTTQATGNSGEADAIDGASLKAHIAQDTTAVTIRSNSQVEADEARAGDITTSSQAIANTQGLGIVGGQLKGNVTQSSAAAVEADGGAVLGATTGTMLVSGLAVSNNVTATGLQGSSQTLRIGQSMTGDHTQATKFTALGTAQSLTTNATATANNASISNEGGPLNVVTSQTNTGYLRAQAESTAFSFGLASSVATGVGNSVIAGETGAQLSLDNTQSNSGAGIDVIANQAGAQGYDLAGSAVAMGNAVTGFACTTCGGHMDVGNSQTNSAEVGAQTAVNAGQARSVTGVATAVGNNATFHVSRPGG